jgi:hypothetical protein
MDGGTGNMTIPGTLSTGEVTVSGRLISKADGSYGTIRCFPIAANGESSIGLYRNSNADVSVAGDFWAVGHNAYGPGDRNFGIGCHGKGVCLSISPTGVVGIPGSLLVGGYHVDRKPWVAGSVNANGTKASDIGQNTFTVAHGLGSGQYDVYWDSGTFHPLGTAYPTFVQAYGDFRATVVNFSNTRIKVSTYFNTTLTDVPFCFQILS